jgi:glycine/serine hydroxymethyltransferase
MSVNFYETTQCNIPKAVILKNPNENNKIIKVAVFWVVVSNRLVEVLAASIIRTMRQQAPLKRR